MRVVLIRAVVYADAAGWCAHALDCDTVVMARTRDAAVDILMKVIQAQLKHEQGRRRRPLSAWGSAPRPIWQVFSAAATAQRPSVLNRIEDTTELQLLVASAVAPGRGAGQPTRF